MAELLTTQRPTKKNLVSSIVLAGLIAGILDALAAVIGFLITGGKDPIRIFKFIASGVFGIDAINGGMLMALLGLMFHLIIATIWATIYFFAYARIELLSRNWWLSGLGYGIVVWMGMNLAVVPLSRTPPVNQTVSGAIVGIVILMFCVGLPISFFARKHFHGKN